MDSQPEIKDSVRQNSGKNKIIFLLARWLFIFLLASPLLFIWIIKPPIDRAERRKRAEVYMLMRVKAIVQRQLDEGGTLPINWTHLSTDAKWDETKSFAEYNDLPLPQEAYTFLQQPIFYSNYDTTGSVFMVHSKPQKLTPWFQLYGKPGRRALMWGRYRIDRNRFAPSNTILSIWVKENGLPPAIRSQLPD